MTGEERKALRETIGRVYHTETFGTVDGPGIRFVVFLQGCPLRCLYCHNPDSIPAEGGTVWKAGDLADEIERYLPFIKRGGVTFSGGEPLMQPEFVYALGMLLKEKGLHIAIDTAGIGQTEKVMRAVAMADLLLLDIKAFDPALCKEVSGRDNALSFELLDWCEAHGKPVWVRQVLLRGYTLDEAQLAAFADKLAGYTCIERVELLPFHKLGEPKWEVTPFAYKLADVEATTGEEAEWAKEIFRSRGLAVQ